MAVKFSILVYLLSLSAYYAQPSFSEHIVDSSFQSTLGVSKMIVEDINGDKFSDLIILRKTANELAFYPLLSTGEYGPKQTISSGLQFPVDVCSADFDHNGWPDLAIFEYLSKSISIFYNSSSGFGMPVKIDSLAFFAPTALFAADLDTNGFEDLVSIDDTVVNAYLNDGVGGFTKTKIAGETEFYSGAVGDINNDGLPDVLLGSVKLYTYLNTGNGQFIRETTNESLINNFIFEIEMGDIDKDGDNDIAIYYSNTDPNIDWYSNNGSGTFSLGGTITNSADDVHSMRLSDLNNDSLPDLLTAYGQSGKLVWIPNSQNGFGAEIVLKTYPIILREVAVGDIDRDGDVDVFCGHNSAGIYYWENLSPHFSLTQFTPQLKIYPNPVQGMLQIKVDRNMSVRLFNLQGQVLFNSSLQPGVNTIDFHDLADGVYSLLVHDGNLSFSYKLIKQ